MLSGEQKELRQAEETARALEERPPALKERRNAEERGHGSAPGAEPQSHPDLLPKTTRRPTAPSVEPGNHEVQQDEKTLR